LNVLYFLTGCLFVKKTHPRTSCENKHSSQKNQNDTTLPKHHHSATQSPAPTGRQVTKVSQREWIPDLPTQNKISN